MNKDHFVERTTNKGHDTKKFREYVVARFEEIHQNIECAHKEPNAYYLAEGLLLQQDVDGPVVECGCFKGGMSAKFSVICKELGKELHLIDSFQGLPCEEQHISWRGEEILFGEGAYKGSFDEVNKNINDCGEISVCRFHQGWFEGTIHKINLLPSFVFIDVDIISSAKICIKHFWPKLQGTRFYTHEACLKTYMNEVLNKDWWKQSFNENVPECIGKVNGYYDAQCLAYLKKEK